MDPVLAASQGDKYYAIAKSLPLLPYSTCSIFPIFGFNTNLRPHVDALRIVQVLVTATFCAPWISSCGVLASRSRRADSALDP